MLKSYLKKIFKTANQGDAREESYYSVLKALMEETEGYRSHPDRGVI